MKTKISGIEITNPNKIVYPKSKITKLDIITYYKNVAKYMLPFVKDRVLCAIRCHETINNDCFFKKHPTTEKNFVNIIKIDGKEYFYIKTAKDIIYQAQIGTLEFHTQANKISSPNKPDFMVFDLDPAPNLPLKTLMSATLTIKEILNNLGLNCYIKTSGGKGYHIVVPFSKTKSYNSFKTFAQNIALLCEKVHPELFTTSILKKDRKGKIFVDYLRNQKSATCVCAYSLRARPFAPVSVPICWEHLPKIPPNHFTIKTAITYTQKYNPWQNIFKENQSLK